MLPQEFVNNLKSIYPEEFEIILKTFEREKPTTFRFNTLYPNAKSLVDKEFTKLGIKYIKGPFENSYIVTKDNKISFSDAFNKGYIYVQELSSMVPPLILDPNTDEYILDMTAAPGSKTTQLAVLAQNKANIMAIEKSNVRYQKLNHNIKLQNAKVKTKNENAIALAKKYPEFLEFFDKILLDAPCSSEGRFITANPKSYKYWRLNKIKEMQRQQKRLILTAIKLLKPGGTLVYSTCTINIVENEEIINWILKRNSNLQIETININIPNIKKGITKRKYNDQIERCIRIIPNELFSAFFVAKIKKI